MASDSLLRLLSMPDQVVVGFRGVEGGRQSQGRIKVVRAGQGKSTATTESGPVKGTPRGAERKPTTN